MAIISRTPVRISFGCGGTDFASYYEEYTGCVLSTAINKYFYTVLELRDDDRVQLISADLQMSYRQGLRSGYKARRTWGKTYRCRWRRLLDALLQKEKTRKM